MIDTVARQAEVLLKEFNHGLLCRTCLHSRAEHLHGLMACCHVSTMAQRGNVLVETGCDCEGLR